MGNWKCMRKVVAKVLKSWNEPLGNSIDHLAVVLVNVFEKDKVE